MPRFFQAVTLERCDQIVREPNDFQVERISSKRGGRDLAEGKIFAQFADTRFHPGASVVEVPDAGRRQVHLGYPSAIDVALHLNRESLGCRPFYCI